MPARHRIRLAPPSAAWLGDPKAMTIWMLIMVFICFGICSLGLQKGVERITKVMMSFLLIILVILCIRSVTLEGAAEGIRFYLIPDFGKMIENGLGEAVYAAHGSGFLYAESRYRCHGYFRKLYQ